MLQCQDDQDEEDAHTIGDDDDDDDDDDFDDAEFDDDDEDVVAFSNEEISSNLLITPSSVQAATSDVLGAGKVGAESTEIPSDPRTANKIKEVIEFDSTAVSTTETPKLLSTRENITTTSSTTNTTETKLMDVLSASPGDIPRDVLASMLQVLTGGSEDDSQDNIDEITQQALRLLSGQRTEQQTTTDNISKNVDNSKKSPSDENDKNSSSNDKEDSQDGPSKQGIPSSTSDSVTNAITIMKTPDKSEQDENTNNMGADMYTLEEILQLHKLSKMVAEKEKKIHRPSSSSSGKETGDGDATKDGSSKKNDLVATLKEMQRLDCFSI